MERDAVGVGEVDVAVCDVRPVERVLDGVTESVELSAELVGCGVSDVNVGVTAG